MKGITPFLWFDTQAEEAAKFYVSVFKNSRILNVTRYGEGSPGPTGSVMTVTFEIDGQDVIALNGGPRLKLSDAFSFSISCDSQEEIDYFWAKLSDGGEEGPCGWLKDKFGLSWQVNPRVLMEMINDPDRARSRRAMEAMLKMKKLDIAALKSAYDHE